MRYIEFGENKEKVSEIIMGLMRISDMTVKETAALIDIGLEEGINFLDLADIYGNGKSEEIVGSVFTENPGVREKFFFSQNAESVLIRILHILIFQKIIFWKQRIRFFPDFIQIIWTVFCFTDQTRLWSPKKLQKHLTGFTMQEKCGISVLVI